VGLEPSTSATGIADRKGIQLMVAITPYMSNPTLNMDRRFQLDVGWVSTSGTVTGNASEDYSSAGLDSCGIKGAGRSVRDLRNGGLASKRS